MDHYINVRCDQEANISKIFKILRKCGYAMALRGLFHWIPSYSKRRIRKDCQSKVVILVWNDDVNDYTSTFQMYKDGDTLYVRKIATLPKYEGRGIGSNNLKYMENYAKEVGCNKVSLDVYNKSKGAISFYIKNGFEIIGEVKSLRFKSLLMSKLI